MTPPPPTPSAALRVAEALALEVGRDLLARFSARGQKARTKADASLVTAADQEADRRLSAGLRAAFPTLPVLSEEGETTWPVGATAGWVVDPLDGTTNFALGLPIWGVSVAYIQEGTPAAGVVHFPALGLTVTAVRDQGAWSARQRLRVRPNPAPGGVALVALCSRTARRLRVLAPWKARVWGSATYEATTVALGQSVAALHASLKVWDVAAVWLIVREAGGLWRPWGGSAALPFPLTPGTDYAEQAYPLMAVAGEAMVDQLGERLRPWAFEKDGVRIQEQYR